MRDARTRANSEFFEAEAGRLASCCHLMAERFARGGRLLAVGRDPAARSDVRHVAVEFVHPVIVGKRALPAIGLGPEGGPLALQVGLIAEPDDIVIGFDAQERSGQTREALGVARDRGCMTIAFATAGAEWEFVPPGETAFLRQELVETLYHVLWELVHVFFDHRGLLTGRESRPVHDSGASSFLYPFLSESQTDLDAVIDDVRASVLIKAAEIGELREQTLGENRDVLVAAARELRAGFEAGAKVLACGNGGSATDAADLVADLRASRPPGARPDRGLVDPLGDRQRRRHRGDLPAPGDRLRARGRCARRALDQRQLAQPDLGPRRGPPARPADGRDGRLRRRADRRRGLADHVVVTRSQHIPRIQEAQASAYHALCELIEAVCG